MISNNANDNNATVGYEARLWHMADALRSPLAFAYRLTQRDGIPYRKAG